MNAVTHNLTQGTKEWLQYRQEYFNASEAAAMLGVSPYMSRDALLEVKATGNTKPIDKATQAIFDEGHRLEAQARPIAEKIIGEDLFQPTMSKTIEGLNLSASFDGLTMLDDVVFEHKTMNEKLRVNMEKGIIPESYKPQLEQQLLVSGAASLIFMASNDDEEMHLWYESDELLRKRLINGWKQFAEDLKNFKQQEVVVEPVAKSVDQLPSLNVQITGGVTASNLETYETNALAFIQSINTDLQTDSDFADADAIVKFCSKTEKELKQVKQAALDQTEDIAALFKTIDNLSSEMRSKRLELDKLVKARKLAIKDEIANQAHVEFSNHLNKVDANLRLYDVHIISPSLNIAEAMKNKRTIESLHNAVNTEVARCKIVVNEQAEFIRSNLKVLEEFTADYHFLFRDIQDIILKDSDDLLNLAKQRISEHKEAEAKRLEAEREAIRLEEEAKAQAKVEAQCKADEAKKLADISALVDEDNQEQKANASNKLSSQKSVESKPSQEIDIPDYDYFRTQMGIILTNMDNYTKDELRTAFTRLADAV